MISIQYDEKSILKLAQCRSLLASSKEVTAKDIDSILEGVDWNFNVSDFPEKYNIYIISSTLLHFAYKKLNIEAYNILIRKGADFNAKNKDGNTVLHSIFDCFCDVSMFSWLDINRNKAGLISARIPFIVSTLSAHIQSKNNGNPSSATGLTHFHIACATNNIAAVEFFLRHGALVNQVVTKAISKKYFEGYTPLHFAAQFGYYEVIEILFEHGANVNLEDAKGKTPLDISVERHIAMIDSPTIVHSDVDITNNEKVINLLRSPVYTKLSPLCIASVIQNANRVECMLLKGLNTDANKCISVESQIWPGYTALHFAAHVDINTVKILIRYGADVAAKDANGVTPFDMCIERYKVDEIFDLMCLVPKWKEIVLSDGKTTLTDIIFAIQSVNSFINVLQKSDETVKLFVPLDSSLWPGFTILHLAVLFSERKKCKSDYQKRGGYDVLDPDLTVITEFLKQDADVTIKDQRGLSPIHLAFRLGKEKVIKLLLQYHHQTKNSVDNENLSHLHVACKVGNQALVEKLLWNGANVNLAYKGDSCISGVHPGWTPLHIAVDEQNHEIAKLLLMFGADVHAIDRDGFTPIHGSSLCSIKFNEMLFNVSNLREIVVPDSGLSYLYVACSIYNVNAAKRLLDLGADVNQRRLDSPSGIEIMTFDKSDGDLPTVCRRECHAGDTPLHRTLQLPSIYSLENRTELVSLLLERGADMLIRNSCNICPLNQILDHLDVGILNVALTTMKGSEDLQKRAKRETGVTMLHLAVRKMDVDLVKELLDDGAEVNAKIHEDSSTWSGGTPLHVLMFIEYNNPRYDAFDGILKLLLDHGADVTLMNTEKCTPLHLAYRRLYTKSVSSAARMTPVSLMLKAQKNFEINPTSDEGISHFHIACHMLDIDVVKKFLEHDVDVNSKIDMFYDYNIAASTPLLLAARTINWVQTDYVKSLAESFAQLKIVDLLIKRGARVNVKDIYGNTPAHYASFGSTSKENMLERLANSGADVNARNVGGQTPLELLLKKSDLTLEEIRNFIACGCHLNSFNSLTEDGYIALAGSSLSHEDMQRLLFGAFVNFPNSVKKDRINRTAIHNIVFIKKSKTSKVQYAELFDLLMEFGCDIDDKDNLGRTALHVAAQFRNEKAIRVLLLVGADINVTDNNGKTPFAYIFEACSHCDSSDRDHDQYNHFKLFELFVSQVRKLQICNLDLHESNEHWLNETFENFETDEYASQHAFLSKLEEISKLKVEPYSIPLTAFISYAVAVIDYPLMSHDKRKAIDEFFRTNKNRFQTQFRQAAGIFQLQYRQAVLRGKIIDEAKDSLSMLMNLRLPDICSHIVLRLLKNSELQNLILSTS